MEAFRPHHCSLENSKMLMESSLPPSRSPSWGKKSDFKIPSAVMSSSSMAKLVDHSTKLTELVLCHYVLKNFTLEK